MRTVKWILIKKNSNTARLCFVVAEHHRFFAVVVCENIVSFHVNEKRFLRVLKTLGTLERELSSYLQLTRDQKCMNVHRIQ